MDKQVIWNNILAERDRQDEKWGKMPRNVPHPEWLSILVEEVGEAAEANNRHDGAELLNELIQGAAVIVSWLEDKF